jgi:hypothetical protein
MNPLKAVRRGITDGADAPKWFRERLIPNPLDQNPWAHWRNPMDMIRQGWSMSLFQA